MRATFVFTEADVKQMLAASINKGTYGGYQSVFANQISTVVNYEGDEHHKLITFEVDVEA